MHLLRAFAINAYVRELRTFLSVLGRILRLLVASVPAYFDRLLDTRLGRYAALLADPARRQLCAD
jgi:hypothetical protein